MQYLKHCFLFFFSFFYLLVPKCVSAWLWERERERETRELKTKRRRRKRVVHLFVHTNVVFRLGRRPWLFSRFQFRFRQLQGNKKNNISRQLFGFKGEVFFFFFWGWIGCGCRITIKSLSWTATPPMMRFALTSSALHWFLILICVLFFWQGFVSDGSCVWLCVAEVASG